MTIDATATESYSRRMHLLSAAEVATRLGVSKRTVQRLVAAGKLPAQHVGTSLVIDETDLDAYVNGRAA